MTTITTQLPTVAAPATPTYTQCTASDKFAANPGTTYLLHYKNGATPTTQCYVTDQYTTVPPGSATPAVPTNATNWSDALISAAIGASAERDIVLDKSIIGNYIDSTGFVNLKHNTPTTLTVAIYGPF
jgi:hypothetical protein